MDELTYSQEADRLASPDDGQNSATDVGPSPMRFTIVALAFIVHFVAWVGFCALMYAKAEYYSAQSLPAGIAMSALACLAGAAAIVIARELSPIPRSIITVLSIAIFGISAIAEVVGSIERPRPEMLALTFTESALLIGAFVFPFVIAGALVTAMGKAAAADRATTGPGLVLLACVVIVFCCHALMFQTFEQIALPSWYRSEWPIALSSAVATVAAVFLLLRAQVNASSPGWSLAIRASGFITLVCGMYLCNLATGQLVAFLPLGALIPVLWQGAVLGLFIGAVALFVSAAVAKSRRS
ncbi:hypothetical protein [Brevibacterium aurantiacum]|uniref:hypothetical protein n=1 Tax=Brevibacterium aurantiacum TaxID=273384 RepID=UPI003F9111BF